MRFSRGPSKGKGLDGKDSGQSLAQYHSGMGGNKHPESAVSGPFFFSLHFWLTFAKHLPQFHPGSTKNKTTLKKSLRPPEMCVL
jgi:hypothetical protein